MFRGHAFLLSLTASPLTVAELTHNGGRVVYNLEDKTPVTCVIIASDNQPNPPARCSRSWATANAMPTWIEDHVRASRITVVYEHWVHQCVRKNRLLLPCADYPDTIAYDPHLFRHVHFTTTQLPMQLKANIIALMQFYGAIYDNHLLDTTNLLVHSHMCLSPAAARSAVPSTPAPLPLNADGRNATALSFIKDGEAADTCSSERLTTGPSSDNSTEAAKPSLTKLTVARQFGIPCVTPQWVQLCLNAGKLLPAQPALASAPLARTPSHHSAKSSATMQADAPASSATDANELRRCEEEVDRWVGEALMSAPHSACSLLRKRPHVPSSCTMPRQKEGASEARKRASCMVTEREEEGEDRSC